jgi:hypothetical protein
VGFACFSTGNFVKESDRRVREVYGNGQREREREHMTDLLPFQLHYGERREGRGFLYLKKLLLLLFYFIFCFFSFMFSFGCVREKGI